MQDKPTRSHGDAPNCEPVFGRHLKVDSTPEFKSLWEARAFAMVVRLSESGCFTWTEWVSHLAAQLRAAHEAAERGERHRTYAESWIDAVETLLIAKGVTSAEQLRARRLASWPLDLAHDKASSLARVSTPTSVS